MTFLWSSKKYSRLCNNTREHFCNYHAGEKFPVMCELKSVPCLETSLERYMAEHPTSRKYLENRAHFSQVYLLNPECRNFRKKMVETALNHNDRVGLWYQIISAYIKNKENKVCSNTTTTPSNIPGVHGRTSQVDAQSHFAPSFGSGVPFQVGFGGVTGPGGMVGSSGGLGGVPFGMMGSSDQTNQVGFGGATGPG